MRLRAATTEDVPALIELGRQVHAESRYAALAYDEARLKQTLGGLIDLQARGSHFVLLAEDGKGAVIGGLIGGLEPYFFTSALAAKSMLLWVAPAWRGSAAALRLINAFKLWATKKGAAEVCILVSSGVTIGRTDRFLRRLGFAQTGGNYAMGVTAGKDSEAR